MLDKLSSLLDYVSPHLLLFLGSGTCRTAFHPLCAREARNRMEVWGKYAHDNVSVLFFFF